MDASALAQFQWLNMKDSEREQEGERERRGEEKKGEGGERRGIRI